MSKDARNKRRKLKAMRAQQTLLELHTCSAKKRADSSIALYHYLCNIPFRTIDEKPFNTMLSDVNKAGVAYKSPGRKALAGGLLDEQHNNLLKTTMAFIAGIDSLT